MKDGLTDLLLIYLPCWTIPRHGRTRLPFVFTCSRMGRLLVFLLIWDGGRFNALVTKKFEKELLVVGVSGVEPLKPLLNTRN